MANSSSTKLLADDFVALHARHQHRVSAFVHMLVPNWQDAEEIVQETFLILWRKIDEFDPRTDFFNWAAKVAQYEVLNYRRLQQRRATMLASDIIESLAASAAARNDDAPLRQESLAKCLKELSADDQELIALRYGEGGSITAAAAATGRTTGHMHRVIRKLRERLLRCVRLRMATSSIM